MTRLVARSLLDLTQNGAEFTGGGCNMTLRDWGRFGLFILGGGKAGGRDVLPPGWVAEATTPRGAQVQYGKLYPDFPLGYGYYWWLYPPAGPQGVPGIDRAFEAEGVFGQNIHIDPGENLVVVTWSTWPEADGARENAEATAFMSGITTAFHAVNQRH
jgi:CubicO group peptidase (beta-lactamase class C family)